MLFRSCETLSCRRMHLLDYFGQRSTSCGNCDTCLNAPSAFDATESVQKLLSAIYRVGQRFGAGHVLDVLRGSDSDKLRQWRHHELSTFGIGADKSEAEWHAILRQVIALGMVAVDHENYGSLRLTEAARPVLRGELTVALRRYQKPVKQRSGSTKLNSLDRCIIGVFGLGKGAGAGDFDEQNLWAA